MKKILTPFIAPASRGAFRSGLAALLAVGALLTARPVAHGYTGPYSLGAEQYFLFDGTAEISANWVVNFGTTIPLRRNLPVQVALFPVSGRLYIYTPTLLTNPLDSCLGFLIDTAKNWKYTSGTPGAVNYELQFGSSFVPYGSENFYSLHVNKLMMPQPGSWTNFAAPGNNQILPSMSDVFRLRTAPRQMSEKTWRGATTLKATLSSSAVLRIFVAGQVPTDMDLKELNGQFLISLTAR
jgi:hypothetical protein